MIPRVLLFASVFVLAPLVVASACSSHFTTAPLDAAPALCNESGLVTIDAPPQLPGLHVPIGTPVDYNSNPPSSGPHYPLWAAYQEFTTPVDRRYYVHDEEHGAIVLLYRCDDAASCPSYTIALEQVVASLPDDPLCTAAGEGIRVRTVITPDPGIPTPIAAAAWGFTYTADCVDLPSLQQFARDHYGQAPEDFCSNGIVP